jgi:hypothetical protein
MMSRPLRAAKTTALAALELHERHKVRLQPQGVTTQCTAEYIVIDLEESDNGSDDDTSDKEAVVNPIPIIDNIDDDNFQNKQCRWRRTEFNAIDCPCAPKEVSEEFISGEHPINMFKRFMSDAFKLVWLIRGFFTVERLIRRKFY